MADASSNTNGDGVRYTVKELLAEIRDDLRVIDAKLDTKASEDKVEALAGRVKHLETREAARDGTTEFKRWVIPLAVFAALGIPGWLLAVSGYFG